MLGVQTTRGHGIPDGQRVREQGLHVRRRVRRHLPLHQPIGLGGFAGTDAAPVGVAGFFAAPGGVSSGIVIDNRTSSNITNGLSTANIYYGTKGVGPATTQSRIVQLNQEF